MTIANQKENNIQNGKVDNSTTPANDLILVRKASGEEEPFSVEKLERSLHNAGASALAISKIVTDIQGWIYSGVTTQEIYTRAFTLLREERTAAATRYKLKQAIMELGPTGYPFESFIGQLFEQQGFEVEVGVVVEGHSVTHEMDVIATQNGHQYLVECKYHKDQGKPVSVQVPLYVRARVDDIVRKRRELPEYAGLNFTGWVVTNTRFSSDSIQYGEHNGLQMLAWDHPWNHGLKKVIEDLGLYPITILSHLTSKEKEHLMKEGIVTCSQLLKNFNSTEPLKLSEEKQKELKEELHLICN